VSFRVVLNRLYIEKGSVIMHVKRRESEVKTRVEKRKTRQDKKTEIRRKSRSGKRKGEIKGKERKGKERKGKEGKGRAESARNLLEVLESSRADAASIIIAHFIHPSLHPFVLTLSSALTLSLHPFLLHLPSLLFPSPSFSLSSPFTPPSTYT
jgi:hypothetical protein